MAKFNREDPRTALPQLEKILDAINKKLTDIGKTYSGSSSKAISASDISTHTLGAYVDLPAGTYVITAQWVFNTRSTTGNTNSQVSIYDNTHSKELVFERVMAAGYNYNALNCATIATFTENTRVYVRGSTSISYTTATPNWIKAVRIA